MSTEFPVSVDVARMVQARRSFAGRLPLKRFKRLLGSLANSDGELAYDLAFDRDAFGSSVLHMKLATDLPLLCQRTLEVYAEPIALDQKLGLIRDESEEAALLADYEALLIGADGQLDLADVIEDELILALPLVPTRPGAPLDHIELANDEIPEEPRENPFAALVGLKKH
ncbi:MAG: YceD family protein [Dokdonella sp.]